MNPFKVVEKIGHWTGKILMYGLAGFAVAIWAVLPAAYAWKEGWGWWSLLGLLVVPVGFAVICFAMVGIWILTDFIKDKWRTAKYRWEHKHRD